VILTGRVPSRHDPRTIRMAQLSPLPAPPPQFTAAEVTVWPTLGNDKAPCCTCAAAAHMIHNWTAAHDAPVLISEDQVLATFVEVSGGAADGAEMLDVLRFWRRSGIAERKLRAYVALDPHRENDLRSTIYLFGAAYIGLSFPDFAVKEACTDAVWDVPEGGAVGENAPDAANGHCVAAIGYDTEHLYVVSCGARRSMTWEFYRAYNDEAYALLSHDWYGDGRRSPTGFDLNQLQMEIAALQQKVGAALDVPAGGA